MNGIKYIREKSNFTKNALAERMGITRQTVTLWENGARKPDRKHLQWLCEFYGIDGKETVQFAYVSEVVCLFTVNDSQNI